MSTSFSVEHLWSLRLVCYKVRLVRDWKLIGNKVMTWRKSVGETYSRMLETSQNHGWSGRTTVHASSRWPVWRTQSIFSPRTASLWLGDDKTAAKDAWMVLALLCGCPRTNFVALALADVDQSVCCSARLKRTIGNWCLLVSRNGSAPFRKQRPTVSE